MVGRRGRSGFVDTPPFGTFGRPPPTKLLGTCGTATMRVSARTSHARFFYSIIRRLLGLFFILKVGVALNYLSIMKMPLSGSWYNILQTDALRLWNGVKTECR
jgi:hypothetical protein